jgi:Holliday junction resolvase RusA-like endonuclease
MPQIVATVEVVLPPVECSPNGRFHWGTKKRAVATYRAQCAAAFRGIDLLTPPITLHLEFFLARPKTTAARYKQAGRYFPKDADNALASVKALVDALKDAGVVPSDAAHNVRLAAPVMRTRAKEHGGRACVLVTIEQGA